MQRKERVDHEHDHHWPDPRGQTLAARLLPPSTGDDLHICCGRCYKVCSRDVFDLKEKSEVMGDDFDDEDQDDVAMVMTVADADDCIGCGACSRGVSQELS